MLVSETHFTNRSFLKINKYTLYDTKHPDGTAHGGTAILIKSNIKHHLLQNYQEAHLQATNVSIQHLNYSLTLSSVYCPPKHKISKDQFDHFFQSLGKHFVAGGDFNAKNVYWGSRLTTTRGRELRKSMLSDHLSFISTGEPTYWPTDPTKIPDLLDFCVTKGILHSLSSATSSLDLSSDHSPVLIKLEAQVLKKSHAPSLINKHTNWEVFRNVIGNNVSTNIPLKSPLDLDQAVLSFNNIIHQAAYASTPSFNPKHTSSYSPEIKKNIADKRRLRKRWQVTRSPHDKQQLNQSIRQIKYLLMNEKQNKLQLYLQNLTPTAATQYSLWKATKETQCPQQSIPPIRSSTSLAWARNDQEKAELFSDHLANVFRPFPSNSSAQTEEQIRNSLDVPFQMELPIKPFKPAEIQNMIANVKPKKSPGFDLISGKILQSLPPSAIKIITLFFNAILRLEYFPMLWKVAQIKMINKPGKNENEVTSYRPISLLPIISKLFEKALLQRLHPIINQSNIIPSHQFGFREQHGTVEQVHRVVNYVHNSFEGKKYCSAVFLDVSQAFDKVWHIGLLYKLKLYLPPQFYQILKSFLENRCFFVQVGDHQTPLVPIEAGVPQGSVLGPLLYVLYTADLPLNPNTEIATFADDTVILAKHINPQTASLQLQEHLNDIQSWLHKWRIKVNEQKSAHITFTLNRETCPPVNLNSRPIPQTEETKYLGMHLDRRLTWKKHIFTKRKQLGIIFQKMNWLLGRNSSLLMDNKLLIYSTIIKPVWTYGIQLWGSACDSNVEIIQRFQSKALREIVKAPYYVPNTLIHSDLHVNTVKQEIQKYSATYKTRLVKHPNTLASSLVNRNVISRLKRRRTPLINANL